VTRLRQTLIAFAAVASLAAVAAGCHAQTETPADKAFGQKVRAYLLAHPEVLEEAFENLQAKQQAAKDTLAKTAVVQHRQALEHDPRDGVLGNPSGKITVVEFFDYRCPFCKASEPDIEKLLADNPDVRLVLKEFPIIDYEDSSHRSRDAARLALGALAQGKYGAVHRALLAEKARLDPEVVQGVLKANGVDLAKAQTVADSKAVADQLTDTMTLAHDLGVDGTPAFVVGQTVIGGARMDDLQAAIAAARKAG
jgi:protein-disulfide isomerase